MKTKQQIDHERYELEQEFIRRQIELDFEEREAKKSHKEEPQEQVTSGGAPELPKLPTLTDDVMRSAHLHILEVAQRFEEDNLPSTVDAVEAGFIAKGINPDEIDPRKYAQLACNWKYYYQDNYLNHPEFAAHKSSLLITHTGHFNPRAYKGSPHVSAQLNQTKYACQQAIKEVKSRSLMEVAVRQARAEIEAEQRFQALETKQAITDNRLSIAEDKLTATMTTQDKVVYYINQGLKNKDIAALLNITPAAVSKAKRKAKEKGQL